MAGPVAKTYAFDAAGNPTSDGTTTYTYNAGGRLSKAVRSGQANEYRHNALGERVIKTGSYLANGPYRFVYDEQGHLVGEYDKDNTPRQETVWLGDTPIAVLKKDAGGQLQTYAIHADHLDTPRAIVDGQNRMVWRWLGSAFGQGLPEEDPDGDGQAFEYNLRFPGQYYDKETGLHYNYFRSTYDAMTGRYGESDPIGLEGGMNTYGYVNNDPLSGIDPNGLLVLNPNNYRVSPAVMAVLADFNKFIGCDKNIIITGGNRTGSSKQEKNKKKLGPHVRGIAADIYVPGQSHLETATQARWSNLFGGVGWYAEGYRDVANGVGPHVHVDVRPDMPPTVWGYSKGGEYVRALPPFELRVNPSGQSCGCE